MNATLQFLQDHQVLATVVATWVLNYPISAAVNALDAPTKDSSSFYRWFFKFSTGLLAQNPSRATGTKVEASPNFTDAVKKANGG